MSRNNRCRGFEEGPVTPENQNTNKEKIRQLEEEKSKNEQEINKLKRMKSILAAIIKANEKAKRRGEKNKGRNKDRGVGKGINSLNELIKEHGTKIEEINEEIKRLEKNSEITVKE